MPPLPLLWPLLLPPPLPLLPPPASLVAPLLPPLPMPAPRRYRLLPPSQQRGLSKLAYASARPSCQTYLHTAVVAVAVTLHCCPCCRRCHSPCHCLCRAAATADMSGAGGVGAEQEKATTEEGLGGGRATGGTGAHCCGHKAGHANGMWAILQVQGPGH